MLNREFDDDLSDLIGGTPRRRTELPAFTPATERAFTEPCRKCGGSGNWRPGYPCFACKGTGKRTFKTPAEQRAKGRQASAAHKQESRQSFRDEHKAEIEWIGKEVERQAWKQRQGKPSFDFPLKMAESLAQYGSWTDGQILAIRKLMLRDEARKVERTTQQTQRQQVIDGGKIEAAFATARAKAARPGAMGIWTKSLKLRAQERDLTFKPGSTGSKWEGMIFVKDGDRKLGSIKAGVFSPRFECSDADKAAIIEACEDPGKAAVAFGKAWSICSVCGRTLTNDESIARGIGPICAENMGF